jgi:hypothetical protein
MKKIFGLMAALLLLTGCDDGDMTFQTFNFGNATVQSCNNNGIVFKISGTQVLILDIDPNAFVDIPTNEGSPRIVTLNGSNSLIYRNYNGSVSSASLCSDIPPASPSVLEEWVALPGGTISIVTTPRDNDQDELVGYNHAITINSATFTKGEETIVIENNIFGTYSEPLPYNFDFLDEEDTAQFNDCATNNLVFRVNGSEALILNVDKSVLFANTPQDPPAYDIATNPAITSILFNKYTGSASTTLLCSTTPPITPTVQTQWQALAGALKVTTISSGGVFRHRISLIGAIFQNSIGENFTIGSEANPYEIGYYETIP